MEDIVPILKHWLPGRFSLGGAPGIVPMRAWTNEVFRVESANEVYALKLYGHGWRRDEEIRYEIDLLRHLHAHGVRVARPVPANNGEMLQHIDVHGQVRQVVLHEYAPGEKPAPPFSSAAYERQGRAAAVLHRAADGFTSSYDRRPLDLEHLVDQPLALIHSLDIDIQTKGILSDLGARVRTRIEHVAAVGLDWGPCHGDLTFDNVHITADGETVWYDFDSGGPGWRAIDLQGWAAGRPEWSNRWGAFLDGYRSARPLADADVAAAPLLSLALNLWGLQVDLERRILPGGSGTARARLAEAADRLTERAVSIGLTR